MNADDLSQVSRIPDPSDKAYSKAVDLLLELTAENVKLRSDLSGKNAKIVHLKSIILRKNDNE